MALSTWVGRGFFFSFFFFLRVFYRVADTAYGMEKWQWSDDSEWLQINPTVEWATEQFVQKRALDPCISIAALVRMALSHPILPPPCLNTSVLPPGANSRLGGQSKWSGCRSQQLWIPNVESNPKPQMSASQITSGREVPGLWYKMARELRTPQCAFCKRGGKYYLFSSLGLQIAFWQLPCT